MTEEAAVESALGLARLGRLYPALILHGGTTERRRDAATRIGRALLCEAPTAERPCDGCRSCRRVSAEESAEGFHPDFHLLERDQKTVTSIEATRAFLRAAQMAPYEARGQVFVVAAAETLGPEAADTLLKILEEPPSRTPRHFLLLAPSSRQLAATLRSRSMALFLGSGSGVDETLRDEIGQAVASNLSLFVDSGSTLYLMSIASILQRAGGWSDLRAAEPWNLAAAAVVDCAAREDIGPALRAGLLDLAAALLEGRAQRVRGIVPQRILEGLVIRYLGSPAQRVAAS